MGVVSEYWEYLCEVGVEGVTDGWVDKWLWTIIGATVAYLPIVFGLKAYFKDRPAVSYRWPFILWNFTLSGFSALGSFLMIFTSKWSVITARHIHAMRLHSRATQVVIALFCLTKMAEYGDTFILTVKKRPTIFLHLYHHVTVTMYCLHAIMCSPPYGHIFAVVNLNIHAVMYMYYGLAIWPRTKTHPLMRKVRPYITSMQLVQMFFGTAISSAELLFPCPHSFNVPDRERDAVLAFSLYVSYAYLFGDFWCKNYTSSAPIRTLLACTPFGVFCVCLPRVLVKGIRADVTALASIALIAVCGAAVAGVVSAGNNEFLTVSSIISPIRSSVGDCKKKQPLSRSIAAFAQGYSVCVDCIRYATIPIVVVTFGWRNSPVSICSVDISAFMCGLSAVWIADGLLAGAFRPAMQIFSAAESRRGSKGASLSASEEKGKLGKKKGTLRCAGDENAKPLEVDLSG